jgi:spermidine synthase
MGHTIAAASTVVAAFMGGLAAGGFVAGRFASRLTHKQSLQAYVALEAFVAIMALLVPFAFTAFMPLLAWAYRDGIPGALFPAVRVIGCLLVIVVPAAALGATFPIAVRWFVRDANQVGRTGGALYAANALGAAMGAVLAGFVLIPWIGMSGTTLVGIAAAGAAIAAVLAILRITRPRTTCSARSTQPSRIGRRHEARFKGRCRSIRVTAQLTQISAC